MPARIAHGYSGEMLVGRHTKRSLEHGAGTPLAAPAGQMKEATLVPERAPSRDLRDCATAYDCRDRLPELSAWMSDDYLKLLRIYPGARFERGHTYFDLTNPERGPFVADGSEGWITNHTYVCRDEVPERVWSQLATWRQQPSDNQAEAIQETVDDFGAAPEVSAAGQAERLPRGPRP
jgi:hypothetical protein